MKLDLSLQQYIAWEVTPVMPLKGKFGYRVFLKYMDDSVKIQQKSGFATEKEAAAGREKTIGELYSGKYIVYANVRFKEFLEVWIEEDIRTRVKSYETYISFKSTARLHIIPVLGNKKMVEINRGDIQKLYNEKTEYSVAVAKSVKTIMNVSMRYAVEKKFIAENPAVGINLPKKVEKTPYHTRNIDTQKTLTQDQIITLLEASRETPIHMQILFNVLMGLRRKEINGLKYSDIDYINRTLTVQRQLGRNFDPKDDGSEARALTKQEIHLKTESSYRIIPIPDYVFEAILEERKRYESNKRRRSTVFQDLDYICCSSNGIPRSTDYHWTHYKKLLKENNLPDIRWHDLRSTFCTLLLKNDFNPKAVSKLMGHAKEIITMDVYGDKRLIIADCVDEIQPFIDEVMEVNEQQENMQEEENDVVIDVCEFL